MTYKLLGDLVIATTNLPNATTSTSGVIILAGDHGGTASLPTVVSLTGSSGSVSIAATGNIITWVTATTAPGIKQADNTTNSATAATLTIQAQNATGTTATGGALNLTSGTGTTASGAVVIKTGGTTRWTANATGVITIANLSTGLVHADSSGNLTSSTLVNVDVNAAAAIAGTKISPDFGSQNIVTTGVISLGTTPSTSGDIRLANGFSLNFRNNANGANLQAVSTSGDTLTIGDFGTSHIRFFSGEIDVYTTSSIVGLTILSTAIYPIQNIRWASTVSSPIIKIDDITTNSATGQVLLIQSQNATGTTSTGGALNLTSGTGTSTNGSVNIQCGGTTLVTVSPTIPATLTIANSDPSISTGVPHLDMVNSGSQSFIRFKLGGNIEAGIRSDNSGNMGFQSNSGNFVFQNLAASASYLNVTTTTVTFATTVTSPSYKQTDNTTNSATATSLTVQAQNATGTTANGGKLILTGGTGTSLPGSIQINISGTIVMIETGVVVSGNNIIALARKSAITSTQMPANTGDGVIYVADAATVPTANSVSGGIMYSTGGAGTWRSSNGTVTTFGLA